VRHSLSRVQDTGLSLHPMTVVQALMFTAVALRSWQPRAVAMAGSQSDDASVLQAVLEEIVLPEVRRITFGRVHHPIVLVWNRTVPFRPKNEPPDGRQLLESFELRNAADSPVPPIAHPEVVLISRDRAKVIRRHYEHRTRGSASVTLPGYSTNGRALVYVAYGCGSLCGYSWIAVLQRSRTGWRLQWRHLLSIS
jgi:hypothetical protein